MGCTSSAAVREPTAGLGLGNDGPEKAHARICWQGDSCMRPPAQPSGYCSLDAVATADAAKTVDDLHPAVRRQRDSAEDLIELTSRDVLKTIVDDVARQQDSHHVSVF